MGKFDSRVDKGILFGDSSSRKAYKCFIIRLKKLVESINVIIDETDGCNIRKKIKTHWNKFLKKKRRRSRRGRQRRKIRSRTTRSSSTSKDT